MLRHIPYVSQEHYEQTFSFDDYVDKKDLYHAAAAFFEFESCKHQAHEFFKKLQVVIGGYPNAFRWVGVRVFVMI